MTATRGAPTIANVKRISLFVLALSFVFAFALGGCARLATDRARYSAGDPIEVVFYNVGPMPVRFYSCVPDVERRVGDRWEPAQWEDADPLVRRNPLAHACVAMIHQLRPDRELTWDLRLPLDAAPGTYRFLVTLRRHGHPRELASPPFAYVEKSRSEK